MILAGEVMMGLDQARTKAIEDIKTRFDGRIPASQLEALDEQIKSLVEKRLKQKVEVLLLCQHATKTIPAENLPRVKESIGKEFEKREVAGMMKKAEVGSRQELDEQLQAMGMSLEARKKEFVEQVLAQEWLRQQAKPAKEEVTHEEMLHYYRDHGTDFDRPARARWEQLMVRVSKYGSRQEAYAALAEMGNQVLRGASLAEAAKARSDGPTATQGGLRDWTSRGSLVSEALNQAIFGLPVGQLSPILEEDTVLHIVRVVEREEGGRVPFIDAQVEISQKIRKQREAAAKEVFLAKLRKDIPVWTVFDGQPEKSADLGASVFR
jgi:hypothetical protein